MKNREAHEKQIRVILADDEFDIQNIVKTLLSKTTDIALIGTCANGQEAVLACEKLHPGILLLDLRMPIMDGFEVAHLAQERFPEIKILVASSVSDYASIQTMLGKKVSGYVNKGALVRNLATNIRAVYFDSVVLSPEVLATHLNGGAFKKQIGDFGLTERDVEVLNLMKAGLTMSEIAIELKIGKNTVKTHVEKIIKKLRVKTRSEALVFAAENNLP